MFTRYNNKKRKPGRPPAPAEMTPEKAIPQPNCMFPQEPPINVLSTYKSGYDLIAYHLCLLGATEERMAQVFGVAVSTLRDWMQRSPTFADAVRRGKDVADAEIANALFTRAKGYSHPDTHFSTARDRDGNTEVIATDTIKYYPPDTTACIFWLKNRQKESWRDTYRTEHTGADGQPIQKRVQLDLSNLTDAELDLAENLGLKLSSVTNEPPTKRTRTNVSMPKGKFSIQ